MLMVSDMKSSTASDTTEPVSESETKFVSAHMYYVIIHLDLPTLSPCPVLPPVVRNRAINHSKLKGV